MGAWVEETREAFLDLQDTLESDPAAARGVLRQLMLTPIFVGPVLDESDRCIGWDYLGAGAMDRVLAGRLPLGFAGPLKGWTTAPTFDPTIGRALPAPVGAADDTATSGAATFLSRSMLPMAGISPTDGNRADFASNYAPFLWEGSG